ncbi:hypothetical protein NPX90_26150 [Bacillus paranthracis]|uniref:hypothetical protein n=1 Tax=Bacillus paranthracis TaxID=2026186 RepID=UPI00211170A7|nr:hypothetical protein [Bacillus paranthracis]MCQ6524971.1 hypothetical protein [Bacillus paranthracis]
MQKFNFKDDNVIEDARQIPRFTVFNQLEDDEVNSVTHYIYNVEIALQYTREGEEIQIPVIVLEGRNEAERYQLPPELWDWGLKFARKSIQYPMEVKFFYIEETNSWEAEVAAVWHK